MRMGRVWLLVVMLAIAVAGCTSDKPATHKTTFGTTYQPPTHTTAPPPSQPPIATGPNVRPGEKPPTFAPSLNRNLPAAADLYARYWIQTLDWGYATADSTLARAVFAPECSDCARFMKNFDETRAEGWHFRGGRVSVLKSSLQPADHKYGATAVDDVTISVQALETLDAENHIMRRAAAITDMTYRTWLRWTGARWLVVRWKEAVPR